MRAFFCLELEPQLREQISTITSRLKRCDARVNWVRAENLHITLKFLGDIADGLIPNLEAAAKEAIRLAQIAGPVTCLFNQLGAFPNQNRPRVIWVGCKEEPPKLQLLAEKLEQALSHLGVDRERSPFVTHVTLGRVKEEGRGVVSLLQAMQKIDSFEFDATLKHLTLMKSDLTPQGSIYAPLFELPFSAQSL